MTITARCAMDGHRSRTRRPVPVEQLPEPADSAPGADRPVVEADPQLWAQVRTPAGPAARGDRAALRRRPGPRGGRRGHGDHPGRDPTAGQRRAGRPTHRGGAAMTPTRRPTDCRPDPTASRAGGPAARLPPPSEPRPPVLHGDVAYVEHDTAVGPAAAGGPRRRAAARLGVRAGRRGRDRPADPDLPPGLAAGDPRRLGPGRGAAGARRLPRRDRARPGPAAGGPDPGHAVPARGAARAGRGATPTASARRTARWPGSSAGRRPPERSARPSAPTRCASCCPATGSSPAPVP